MNKLNLASLVVPVESEPKPLTHFVVSTPSVYIIPYQPEETPAILWGERYPAPHAPTIAPQPPGFPEPEVTYTKPEMAIFLLPRELMFERGLFGRSKPLLSERTGIIVPMLFLKRFLPADLIERNDREADRQITDLLFNQSEQIIDDWVSSPDYNMSYIYEA